MTRPSHLPEYENPPINEVVMGVQFATPNGYQQIYAGEVRDLFKDKFPKVRELEPLLPTFETFGLPQQQQMNFGFFAGMSHNRYWFLSADEAQLIQFQNDRFFHNWRKIGDGKNPYPRFDEIILNFNDELNSLNSFFENHEAFGKNSLSINQCELTYINQINLSANDGQKIRAIENNKEFSKWIKLFNFEKVDLDDFSFFYRKALKNEDNKYYGRFIFEISNSINKMNEPILVMNLTVRGTPRGSSTIDAEAFLREARILIVNEFDQVTTSFAHKTWKRK